MSDLPPSSLGGDHAMLNDVVDTEVLRKLRGELGGANKEKERKEGKIKEEREGG